MNKRLQGTMEFHISREARDRYQFDESLFSITGNVIFANFHAARLFAQKMNQRQDLIRFPENAVRAGQINAMGLIDEILHYIVGLYSRQANPDAMAKALAWLNEQIGPVKIDQALLVFAEKIPAVSVYRKEISPEEYLEAHTSGVPNRQILLEELLLLWLANVNPAFSPFLQLFDDSELERRTAYPAIIAGIHDFFDTQSPFGPDSQNLVDMLRSPAMAVPHSLSGQLEYIRQRWGTLLGDYLFRLLSSLDLIKEEEKAIFLGAGPARVYEFTGMELEPERFSPDKDWMPSLVLIAKNTYVWLDQLSKKYRRDIYRLDHIPDEELDQLARWGFTGLWLIGLWERSEASKRIKQLRGNPEAVASAYSLFEYQIAGDLGGEEAFENLRRRAWQRGIRLASDMVPNHMGIDSSWVIEHPDWFISLDYSPFPSYSFNGPNLSWDDRVGLFIEDHYYDSTDAAVVFRRLDKWTGDTRYIYHGNDGTSMPWNDTAQLNYLLPQVREAVIQTILHVARKFPIIRFDAAMTLAKKHYQRLWFPQPGTGGAIPSRAEHGLTREEFDAMFPKEFWREVVDRVAQEAPDTLLLAEAFWLMEGYFVRTLGMHRVYNSAFMNMLRDEKNQDYRLVIKNTLEFEPEILKRYVNFMNNPDERTAVDQFGGGDKYFGVCTLMVTMPGLPMIGHGQIEGYAEKYGMEFRKAYWQEEPNPYLIERHEKEIFPLLKRRYLFAEVKDFLLYDFYTPDGFVSEDVFAYSNRSGEERTLVVYHNRYADVRGWIRTSAAYSARNGGGEERVLMQKNLAEGLGLHKDGWHFAIFRDHSTGLEYIRNSQAIHEQGLYIELGAYKYHVFLDFREVQDNEWRQYAQLAEYLNGRGVPSIEETIKEIILQPVRYPFLELVNAATFSRLLQERKFEPDGKPDAVLLSEIKEKYSYLLRQIDNLIGSGILPDRIDEISLALKEELQLILELPVLDGKKARTGSRAYKTALKMALEGTALVHEDSAFAWGTIFGWSFIHRLGKAAGETDPAAQSRTWIDEWLLGKIIAATLQGLGLDEGGAWHAVLLIKILTNHQDWYAGDGEQQHAAYQILQAWLRDGDTQQYLQVNRYQGILWYNKESYEKLLSWMLTVAIVDILSKNELESEGKRTRIASCYKIIEQLLAAQKNSEYQVERLLEAVKG